jgi:acyl-homoserine lactone acylase PvdQ
MRLGSVIASRLLFGLLIAALGVAGLGLWWLHRPNPSTSGTLGLPALEQPVQVDYGPYAVPTIRAETRSDLFVAQGFVVARERLWQMDLLRRLAGGRLAELFGAGALVADRFYRTIGLSEAADRSFAALEPHWQQLLERYAEGVNAYLSAAIAGHRLPLEYQLLGLEPSPWRPQDSLLAGAYMAWLNSVNLREELVFLRLAQRLGTERALELFPADQGQPAPATAYQLPDYRLAPSPERVQDQAGVVDSAPLRLAQAQAQAQAHQPQPQPLIRPGSVEQAFSNAWAVAAGRSAEAGALLANDPHLASAIPAAWFQLELLAPGYHVSGVTLPGVPGVLIGHNADLAWGVTASVADTQDLFLERLSEEGTRVLRPDGSWEPIAVRVEQIAVAGQAEPVELAIRSTTHGVLIDELVAEPGANPFGLAAVQRPESLALRLATERPDRSLVGIWRLNTAETLADARAAAADLQQVSLNLLLAHRNGRIAWQVTGLLPERGRGTGTFPAPGWEPGYGWLGYLPFAENPGLTDPDTEMLVSANDAMSPDGRSPWISNSWLAPFRAQRIDQLLRASSSLDAGAMARMQSDRLSLEAGVYLDALRRHLPAIEQSDPRAAALARDELLSWDGDFADGSEAAAFFVLLRPALYQALYGDELAEDLGLLMGLETHTYGPLAEALRTDRSSFWDDLQTSGQQEGPAAVWARALTAAAEARMEAFPGPARPTLAELRELTFVHAFDGQPLLGDLFNLGPIGRGGDNGTIDVSLAPLTRPREIGNVASMRVVFTPSDWSATRGILPLGQSGHRFSPHRADQLDDWLAGRSAPWPWNGPSGPALGRLILQPIAD